MLMKLTGGESLLDDYIETVKEELRIMSLSDPLPIDWNPKQARKAMSGIEAIDERDEE